MDKWILSTCYNGCNYLSMLRLMLTHIGKMGTWKHKAEYVGTCSWTVNKVTSRGVCTNRPWYPFIWIQNPDSKVHGVNMEPIWGRQDPGGPHVGPMNFAIWEAFIPFHLIDRPRSVCLMAHICRRCLTRRGIKSISLYPGSRITCHEPLNNCIMQ